MVGRIYAAAKAFEHRVMAKPHPQPAFAPTEIWTPLAEMLTEFDRFPTERRHAGRSHPKGNNDPKLSSLFPTHYKGFQPSAGVQSGLLIQNSVNSRRKSPQSTVGSVRS